VVFFALPGRLQAVDMGLRQLADNSPAVVAAVNSIVVAAAATVAAVDSFDVVAAQTAFRSMRRMMPGRSLLSRIRGTFLIPFFSSLFILFRRQTASFSHWLR